MTDLPQNAGSVSAMSVADMPPADRWTRLVTASSYLWPILVTKAAIAAAL